MRYVGVMLALSAMASAEERTVALVNVPSARGLQEIATVLRTVADIPKLSIDSAHPGFSLEGTPAQLDSGAWLIHQFDKPAGWQPSEQEKSNPSTREYRLPPTEPANVFRIYYLPENTTQMGIQETLTVLRTVLDVRKIFSYTPLDALAWRGTASDVEAAEWLLHALDTRTVSEPYPLRDGKPFDVLRVFPLPGDITARQTQELLTALRMKPMSIMKVFTRTAPPAIAVRGTAAQVDQAEKLIPPIKVALQ